MSQQKEDIEKIKNIKGYVRGVTLKTDLKYILKKEGEEGLERVEEWLQQNGFELKYKEIKNTKWYPLHLRTASLIALEEVFGWEEDQLFDLGYSAPKFSFFVKTLIKFFVSVERTIMETSKYWQKHYSVGELVVHKIDLDNNNVIVDVKEFDIHPVFCPYFKGYFKAILELITPAEEIEVKEIKCTHEGDDLHRFSFKWT